MLVCETDTLLLQASVRNSTSARRASAPGIACVDACIDNSASPLWKALECGVPALLGDASILRAMHTLPSCIRVPKSATACVGCVPGQRGDAPLPRQHPDHEQNDFCAPSATIATMPAVHRVNVATRPQPRGAAAQMLLYGLVPSRASPNPQAQIAAPGRSDRSLGLGQRTIQPPSDSIDALGRLQAPSPNA